MCFDIRKDEEDEEDDFGEQHVLVGDNGTIEKSPNDKCAIIKRQKAMCFCFPLMWPSVIV